MPKRNYPVRLQIYTLAEVLELNLKDSPFLMVLANGRWSPVQTSHTTDAEVLSVPQFADSLWEYRYTTNEWIPIFHAVDSALVLEQFCDVAPYLGEPEGTFWITPKGFPREQIDHFGDAANAAR